MKTFHSDLLILVATAPQVVDHSGSAEQGAELIFAQLEKVIKQVRTAHQPSQVDSWTLDRVPLVTTSTPPLPPPPWSCPLQELLGLEGTDVDSRDSGMEEGHEEDSGDVLWDLHDEQEQLEAYQQACSSTTSTSGFQKVLRSLASFSKSC